MGIGNWIISVPAVRSSAVYKLTISYMNTAL